MAQPQDNSKKADYQQVLLDDPDFLQGIVANVLQQLIDIEATDHLGAIDLCLANVLICL